MTNYEYRWYFAWGVLIVVGLLVAGLFIGNAVHAGNEQHNKFQMECVSTNGSLQYETQAHELVCRK